MVSVYIAINRVIDAIMGPMEKLPPLVPLVLWSVVVGVIAMVIYKYASSQAAIKDAKDRIKGHFFEVWLYIDDAPVIARSQAKIMWNALRNRGFNDMKFRRQHIIDGYILDF